MATDSSRVSLMGTLHYTQQTKSDDSVGARGRKQRREEMKTLAALGASCSMVAPVVEVKERPRPHSWSAKVAHGLVRLDKVAGLETRQEEKEVTSTKQPNPIKFVSRIIKKTAVTIKKTGRRLQRTMSQNDLAKSARPDDSEIDIIPQKPRSVEALLLDSQSVFGKEDPRSSLRSLSPPQLGEILAENGGSGPASAYAARESTRKKTPSRESSSQTTDPVYKGDHNPSRNMHRSRRKTRSPEKRSSDRVQGRIASPRRGTSKDRGQPNRSSLQKRRSDGALASRQKQERRRDLVAANDHEARVGLKERRLRLLDATSGKRSASLARSSLRSAEHKMERRASNRKLEPELSEDEDLENSFEEGIDIALSLGDSTIHDGLSTVVDMELTKGTDADTGDLSSPNTTNYFEGAKDSVKARRIPFQKQKASSMRNLNVPNNACQSDFEPVTFDQENAKQQRSRRRNMAAVRRSESLRDVHAGRARGILMTGDVVDESLNLPVKETKNRRQELLAFKSQSMRDLRDDSTKQNTLGSTANAILGDNRPRRTSSKTPRGGRRNMATKKLSLEEKKPSSWKDLYHKSPKPSNMRRKRQSSLTPQNRVKE